VAGWVMAGTLNLSLAAVAFAGLGALLATNVLTLDDINLQGGTLVTFIWLAVLFALSGQLNELGFMGYVGARLTSLLGGITWPVAYVVLLLLYVLMHYMFVSQSAQILALFDVFLGVAVKAGVPAPLMAFAVLFALSGQLNELGFMGYVGARLTSLLGGITWPVAYVVLLLLYVLMHYMFVSQSAQILALFDVFLGVAVKAGVPAPLMAFALL